MWAYSPVTNAKYSLFKRVLDTSTENTSTHSWPKQLPLTSGDVVYVEVTTDQNSTVLSCDFDITLIKNT